MLRLIGAQAGDPAGGAGKRAVERFDLAHMAAGLARRDRGAKAVGALPVNQGLERRALGHDGANVLAVAALGLRPDVVRLGKQAAGIERDQVDGEILRQDGVADRLVFQSEAGGEDQRAFNGVASRLHALE